MEKMIAELKEIIQFKDTTEIGDIVLIAAKEPQQIAAYALVTDIERDQARKDEWWHVSMQLLTVPIQPVIWTLRIEQFTGQEVFTMGGKARFVKAVHLDQKSAPSVKAAANRKKGGLRVIK